MERIDGERVGTSRYYYKGFFYHADSNYPGRRYVCISKTAASNKCNVSALIKNGVVTVRRVHTHPPPKSLKTYLASKDMKILARNELHLSPSQIMNRAFADTLENQLFPNVPVSKMYSESTDEPEALDDWEELEAILVALQDPPELQMTAESASGNRVTAPRQHPFLLRKSEKGGCYHLEKVAMVVGIVKLPANTTTKPMKNS